MKLKRIVTLFLIIIILYQSKTLASNTQDKNLKMYFLSEVTKNRGSADTILLEENGKFGMIDTGTIDTATEVYNFLKSKNVTELEFLLITHCHSDHIGGAKTIVENFKVKNLYIKEYDDKYSMATGKQKIYDDLLEISSENNVKIIGPSTFYGESYSGNNRNLDNSVLKYLI